MIDETYVELINRQIDGEITDKEQIQLADYLSKNPEARELADDLIRVSHILDGVPKIEPPPHLKKHILNIVKPVVRPGSSQRWGVRIPSFLTLPKISYASVFMFIIGAFLGVASYSLLVDKGGKSEPLEVSNLYGSMTLQGLTLNLTTGGREAINIPGLTGTATLKYSPEIVVADLHLNAREKFDLNLHFSENDLSFNTFSQTDNASENLEFVKETISIRNLETNDFLFIFRRKSKSTIPLKLTISNSGSVLFEKELVAGRDEK